MCTLLVTTSILSADLRSSLTAMHARHGTHVRVHTCVRPKRGDSEPDKTCYSHLLLRPKWAQEPLTPGD